MSLELNRRWVLAGGVWTAASPALGQSAAPVVETTTGRVRGVAERGSGERASGERGREARERFRAEIGRRFDLVVIDGGAITENPQAASLMPLADGVLLVARLGATAQRDVAEAVEAAGLAGHPVSAGLIVTQA